MKSVFKTNLILCIGVLVLGFSADSYAFGSKKSDLPELNTVDQVDVVQYLGTWYDIAHYPQSFQEGCTGTTATYSLREDGDIDVLNRCYLNSLDGELSEAHGRAWVVDTNTNAKLKVRFFWPFSGNYWIIELGKNYEYAVVGEPSREYLWILSRTPKMDSSLYNEILSRLETKGYSASKLELTPQRN